MSLSWGGEVIWALINLMDIILLHNIYSFSSTFSEENKPVFPQSAGKLRPSQ